MLLVFTFPAITLPVTLANPVAKTLLPKIFPLAVIKPAVVKLPPVMLAVTDTTDPNKLEPVIVPVELINPPVKTLPPVTLPLALNTPVMYSPVVANTATLPVPPTPTETLPPELTTVTFDVPLLMLATLVITPVSNAPLPRI